MKKVLSTIALIFCFTFVFAQEGDKVWLDFQTDYFLNPSYVTGKLQEISQISYKATLVDGKVLRGDKIPWKYSNKTTVHARYLFTESGQLIQKTTYDDSGNFYTNVVLSYDDDSLQKMFYMRNDTLAQINEIRSDGKKIYEIKYVDVLSPTVFGFSKYSYDENGFMLQQENFNGDGLRTMVVKWGRDDKGRMTSYEAINEQGEIIYSGHCEYGEFWEPTMIISKYSGGKEVKNIIKKEYEFDENGNWTKLIRYRNDVPESITFRTFKFFIDKTEITLPESLLIQYVGRYELMPDYILSIFKEGTNMFGQVSGQDKFEIFAYQKHKFFLKDFPAHLEFHFNDDGSVSGLTFVQGQELYAKRIE